MSAMWEGEAEWRQLLQRAAKKATRETVDTLADIAVRDDKVAYKAVCALIVHEMKHLKPAYRLKLFYVMSAVLRASKTQRGDRDKYAARFEPLLGTVADLLEAIPADQLPSVVKVLDLWWCDDIFDPATIAGLQKRFKALAVAAGGAASSAGGSAGAAGAPPGPAVAQQAAQAQQQQQQQQQQTFQVQYQQPQQQVQQHNYSRQPSPAIALSSMSAGSLSAGLPRDGPPSAAASLGTAPAALSRPPSAASRAPGAGGDALSGWASLAAPPPPLHAVGSSSRLLEQQHQAPPSQQGAYDPFNPDPAVYLAPAPAAGLPPPPPPPLAAGQAPQVPPPPQAPLPPQAPPPPPPAVAAAMPAANGAALLPQQMPPGAPAAAADAQTPRKRKSRWADA